MKLNFDMAETQLSMANASQSIINLAMVPDPNLVNQIAGWGGVLSVILQLAIKVIPQVRSILAEFKKRKSEKSKDEYSNENRNIGGSSLLGK